MHIGKSLLAATILLGLAAGSAQASPVQFGSSYYEFIFDSDISWNDANSAAASSSFLGSSGYLATVTSSAENDFLANLVPQFSSFAGGWLGIEVSGGIGSWTGGPEAGLQFSSGGSALPGQYANWGGVEPNNSPGNGYMNLGPLFAGIQYKQWADAANGVSSGGDPIKGYFVEYTVTPVPIPATLPLLAAGLGALGFIGLRRKRKTVAAVA